MAKPDDTYDPSTVEVDRGRTQGLGVGQRDLDAQRDPGDGLSEEKRGVDAEDDRAADERIQAGPPGEPDKAYDGREADEVSFSQT